MSSRQEEKERRKREREEREAAERAKTARGKRLQLVLGVVIAIVVIGVGGFALVSALGGDDDSSSPTAASGDGAAIPPLKEGDLKTAVKLAGCTLKENLPNEGANHEEKTFKPSDYKQNPPTSGTHFPQYPQDGIYTPDNTPPLGQLVHTLEHGRIDIQYKPGTDAKTVSQLETLYNSMDDGHHLMLFQNTTNMPFAVAATAWDNQLGCKTMNPQVFDAIRAFTKEHIDKGPEVVP